MGFDANYVKLLDDGITATYKLTKDTVYLYIDAKNEAGVEGGALALATEPTEDTFTENVYYVIGTESKVKLLVYEINNDLAAQ